MKGSAPNTCCTGSQSRPVTNPSPNSTKLRCEARVISNAIAEDQDDQQQPEPGGDSLEQRVTQVAAAAEAGKETARERTKGTSALTVTD